VEKVYTKTLYNKFKWAIDDTKPDWDYENTDLLQGFEQLYPSKEGAVCTATSRKPTKPTKKTSRKPRKVTPDSDSDSDSESESDDSSDEFDDSSDESDDSSDESDDKPLAPPKYNRTLIAKFHKALKKYGYTLLKLEDGRMVLQRVTSAKLVMQVSSTFKYIYELSKQLIDDGLAILGMLLVGQLCKDATENSKIKKALIKSGYIKRLKDIVRKSI
jgi:hypothetical protein